MESLSLNLLTISLGLLIMLIFYIFRTFSYWKVRGVPYEWIFSFVSNPLIFSNAYNKYKSIGKKYFGLYMLVKPALMLTDLNLMKHILSIDFQQFNTRGLNANEGNPISTNLFNTSGTKWKKWRTKLTPTFTSGKMKMMFSTVVNCAKGLENNLRTVLENKDCIDIKALCRGFTTEVISSVAFGIECNGFDEKSDFRRYGEIIFEQSFEKRFKRMLRGIFPTLTKFLGISHHEDDINFFFNLVKNIVEYREKNNYIRPDFMQLLIELKNNKSQNDSNKISEEPVTIEEITAQAFTFFAASFETSSTTMSFFLYELAINEDIQDKVRNEINRVLSSHNDVFTYEALSEMKYLSQVMDETLRKYPPGTLLTRKCIDNYKIPDSDLTIEKGTVVLVPVYQIHHDSEYYENPETFDPDRFSDANKSKIPSFAYIPFGEGPRICIGLRFGLMQTKIGLIELLRKYRFTLNEKTPSKLAFHNHSLALSFKDVVYLNVDPIAR